MIRDWFRRWGRAKPQPAPGSTLTAERRAEVEESLREEFDLLCLGIPSRASIDAALRMAEGAR